MSFSVHSKPSDSDSDRPCWSPGAASSDSDYAGGRVSPSVSLRSGNKDAESENPYAFAVGWEMPKAKTYAIPPWLEMLGAGATVPTWCKGEDGNATIDYRMGMRAKPIGPVEDVEGAPKTLLTGSKTNIALGADEQEPCWSWANSNICKYGKKCKYLHEGANYESSSDSDSDFGRTKRRKNKKKKAQAGGMADEEVGYINKWGGLAAARVANAGRSNAVNSNRPIAPPPVPARTAASANTWATRAAGANATHANNGGNTMRPPVVGAGTINNGQNVRGKNAPAIGVQASNVGSGNNRAQLPPHLRGKPATANIAQSTNVPAKVAEATTVNAAKAPESTWASVIKNGAPGPSRISTTTGTVKPIQPSNAGTSSSTGNTTAKANQPPSAGPSSSTAPGNSKVPPPHLRGKMASANAQAAPKPAPSTTQQTAAGKTIVPENSRNTNVARGRGPPQPTRPPVVCRWFFSPRGCRFGNQCFDLHTKK